MIWKSFENVREPNGNLGNPMKTKENLGKREKIKGLLGAVNGLSQAVAIPKSVQKQMKNCQNPMIYMIQTQWLSGTNFSFAFQPLKFI